MCDQCEVLMIQGVKCHETGCPVAWQDYTKECEWCGTEFKPEERNQNACDASCAEAYYGSIF